MKKQKQPEQKTQKSHWANCFLEHAARETCWMKKHAAECNYQAAHDAATRRNVWLTAALYAQQEGK